MKEERLWILALCLLPRMGPKRYQQICKTLGSAQAFFRASDSQISKLGLGKRFSQRPAPKEAFLRAEEEYQKLKEIGGDFITLEDENYPWLLKEIPDPPPVLFYKGQLKPSIYSLAVVGSRSATSYGISVTKEWIKEIARAEVTIISGLALGIDTIAHKAALEVQGKTIAVLGCGLDYCYPSQNQELFQKIAEKGTIFTEFPLGTKPRPAHFPIRNRIISGLSQAVLVVEASPKSGSLITARWAGEQGREVMVVPGSIYSYRSHGCHQLIREGALLVDKPEQVLENLGLSSLAFGPKEIEPLEAPSLDPEEEKVWKILEVYPQHIDEIVYKLGLEVSRVSGILLKLELKGLVKSSPGNFYQRVIKR